MCLTRSVVCRFKPPGLPSGFFAWIIPVLHLPDAEFASAAGFDALIYVRFLRFCTKVAAVISVVTLFIVLPTNWAGGDFVDQLMAEQGSDGKECSSTNGDVAAVTSSVPLEADMRHAKCALIVTSFDKTSLTNISPGSDLMWVHVIVSYMITTISLKLLWNFYRDTIRWRMLFLSRLPKGAVAHTVYVHDIPGTPHGTVVGRIYDVSNGTLGKVLPSSFKAKLDFAMDYGLAAIGVIYSKARLAKSTHPSFVDQSLDVYKEPVDPTGPSSDSDAQSGSPGRCGPSGRARLHTTIKGAGAHSGNTSSAADFDKAGHVNEVHDPVHWSARPAGTDFETWRQAEAAFAEGVAVHDIVCREFARTFGADQLEHVSVVRDDSHLRPLVSRYMWRRRALEQMQDAWAARLRRGRRVNVRRRTVYAGRDERKIARFGQGKSTVGEMQYRMWELDEMLHHIHLKQAEVDKSETCAAFVTMRSRLAQTLAATGSLSFDETQWITEPAPPPESVLWDNVALRNWERGIRRTASWAVFALLVAFYIPVVSGVQGIVNLAAYSNGSFVARAREFPVLDSLMSSVISTVVFKLFLVLVPSLLHLASRHIRRAPSLDEVDREVAVKLFVLFYFVIFVMNTIIGLIAGGASSSTHKNAVVSLLEYVKTQGFGEVLNLLGTALPQQAPFFIFFILTDGLFASSLQFLRLPGAAIYTVMSQLAASYRQKKSLSASFVFFYGPDLPGHTTTVVLLYTFAVVQPLLPVFALLYFLIAYFFARYTLLYTRREAYQSGGLLWPVMFEQVIVALMTFLIGTSALLAVKKFTYAPVMLPLVVAIIVFRVRVERIFGRPMSTISSHAAADLDRNDQVYDWYRDLSEEEVAEMRARKWDLSGLGCARLGPVKERYIQETMLVSKQEHACVMADSLAIMARVEEFNAGNISVLEDKDFMAGDGPAEGEYKPEPHVVVASHLDLPATQATVAGANVRTTEIC